MCVSGEEVHFVSGVEVHFVSGGEVCFVSGGGVNEGRNQACWLRGRAGWISISRVPGEGRGSDAHGKEQQRSHGGSCFCFCCC